MSRKPLDALQLSQRALVIVALVKKVEELIQHHMTHGAFPSSNKKWLVLSGFDWLENEARELIHDPLWPKRFWRTTPPETTLTTPDVHAEILRTLKGAGLSLQPVNADGLAASVVATLVEDDHDNVWKVYQGRDDSAALPDVTETSS